MRETDAQEHDLDQGDDLDAVVSTSRQHGAVWLITCRGDIDLETAEPLREAVAEALREQRGPVVIDTREVTFCDSTTLNILLHLAQRRPVGLVAVPQQVRRLLELTGTREVLPAFDDVDSALAALAP